MIRETGKPASPAKFLTLFASRAERLNLKNFVTKEPHKAVAINVFKTGHSVRVIDEICNLRKEIGLPQLPPTTLVHDSSLKEVKAIMKKTGLIR